MDERIYGAFSLHNSRVQEYVPGHPQRLVLHYDSESNIGMPKLIYERPLNCLYGVHFAIWIGPAATVPDTFVDRIRSGAFSGERSISDRPCYSIIYTDTFLAEDGVWAIEVTHIYYVDKENYFLRGWDTDRGGDLTTRRYAMVKIDETAQTLSVDI